MKIFVAGMSGTGKSTVANKLSEKGFNTIDIDHVPGLCSWVEKETREKVPASNIESVDDDFMEKHDFACDIEMLKGMLGEPEKLVYVFGNVGDNSTLIPLFDKIFLLHCTPQTLLERLKTRDTNSFGKDVTVHERLLNWFEKFNKLMREAGAIPINTEDTLETVINKITNDSELKKF